MINIDDFLKVELRIGTVVECEDIEESEKLLKLKVDLGEEIPRQVLSGIKQWYKPEDLIGKQFIFVTNLEPRMMMGQESQAMILAAEGNPSTDSGPGRPIPLIPSEETKPGAKIK